MTLPLLPPEGVAALDELPPLAVVPATDVAGVAAPDWVPFALVISPAAWLASGVAESVSADAFVFSACARRVLFGLSASLRTHDRAPKQIAAIIKSYSTTATRIATFLFFEKNSFALFIKTPSFDKFHVS